MTVALTIKADPMPAVSIERAAAEAMRLARLLGVGVEFDFNGVTCLAFPTEGHTPEAIVAGYGRLTQAKGRPAPLVTSNPGTRMGP